MKHELLGQVILPGDVSYCSYGGDHRKLVAECRLARIKLEQNVEESSVVCARCIRAISLKV